MSIESDNSPDFADGQPAILRSMGQVIRQVEETQYSGFPNIPSGILSLDRILYGWRKSSLYVVAGPPSMGCTSLMLAFMRNAIRLNRRGVAFFSMQMRCEMLLTKWLSLEVGLPYKDIEGGNISEQKWLELSQFLNPWTQEAGEMAHIVDTPNPTIDQLAVHCNELRAAGAELFLIDNLQRITLGKKDRTFCANREQEVSLIVRRLKTLAYELNAPIVVVAEMNRLVTERSWQYRPQLSDLRDSGAIENEADGVIFLYRPEFYGITEDEMGNPTYNTAELIVAKNSLGETDTAVAQFVSKYGLFQDLEHGNNPIGSSNYTGETLSSPPSSFPAPFSKQCSPEDPPF